MTSFKLGCKTYGDTNWAYNALRFPTKEAAEAYGMDLYSRWMALYAYEAHECTDEVNVKPVEYRHGSV